MINIFVGISNEWAEYQKLWEFVTPVTLTIFQIHHLKWHLFTIYNFTFTFAIVFLPNGFILTSKAHKYSARLRMFVNFTVSMVPMAFLYAICSCSTILKNGVVHAQRTRTKHIYICIYFDVLRHLFPTNRLCTCRCIQMIWTFLLFYARVRVCNFNAGWMKFAAHTKHTHTKLHDNFYWWGHPTPKITIIMELQIATVPKIT